MNDDAVDVKAIALQAIWASIDCVHLFSFAFGVLAFHLAVCS
jgi:hypothetical protein